MCKDCYPELLEDQQKAFEFLTEKAVKVSKNSYSPYSNYKVGCALITDDGHIFTGCNVENASYGLTLCAECTCIGNMVSNGCKTIRYLVCVDADGNDIAPCGRCRQIIVEHSDRENSRFSIDGKIYDCEALLPASFEL